MRVFTHSLPLPQDVPACAMQVYLLDNSPEVDERRLRPLVIICPGGAYSFRSFREAEPVALRLLAAGFHAAVLEYSVAPAVFPQSLLQLLCAISQTRAHAADWQVDGNRIVLMGFSAGGHLAASAGVFWDKPHYAKRLGLPLDDVKPNGLILGYPVITSGLATHGESMRNLLGDQYDLYVHTVSLEKQTSSAVPPTFLWHTWDDAAVPVENALQFACALRQHGVSTEVHIYRSGEHGLSLANDQVYGPQGQERISPDCAGWMDLAAQWLRRL